MKDIRKIFKVIIYDKEYYVYDIEGKEHMGENDTPKTWWIYYTDVTEEINKDSKYFVPFVKGINRLLWDIKITQRNTTKFKWDELRFNNHTYIEMWCNKKLVYAFSTLGDERGISFGMAKVQYLQTVLCEHPYNFLNPEEEQGRKICWYGLPATVRVQQDTWEIGIVPDYTTGLSKKEWWDELKRKKHNYLNEPDEDDDIIEEYDSEAQYSDYINWGDALSDGNIYWFRK